MTPSLDEKRKQWLDALDGDDRNAIKNQIVRMTWDAAAFRVINEALRLAPPAPQGGVKLNGLMHDLLNRGFFLSQMVAIRRLNDASPLEGKKGVHSVTGLLQDLQQHRQLLTRKAIFETEGIGYDLSLIRRTEVEHLKQQLEAGNESSVPPVKDSFWSEQRHLAIDHLSGIAAANRRPDDTIHCRVLDDLCWKMYNVCQEVIEQVNKFIAHAATPASRAIVKADAFKVTLNHLQEAHRVLCQVVSFLSVYVLGGCSFRPLPFLQFNQFEYIATIHERLATK